MRTGTGGSDPFIVLNDADLELAVKAAVAGRYQNTGQVCAAAKRFIVEEGIAQAFTDRFVAAAAALKMGILWLKRMTRGRWRALICVMNSINRCRLPSPKATRLLLGGEKIAGEGNYYAATVLADVTPDMTAFRQELFVLPPLPLQEMRRTPSRWRMTVSLACRRRSLPPTIRWPRGWRRVLSAAGYSLMGTAPAMRVWHSAG